MPVRTLLDSETRASIVERAARLSAKTAGRWGSMDASQMMRHCAEALRGSLGEVRHQPLGKRLFHTRAMKFLVFRVLPFPKNAPTAPELRRTEAAVLDAERTRFVELVNRYAALPAADPLVEHPFFGVLTQREWAELEFKHLDHHLRQFGV